MYTLFRKRRKNCDSSSLRFIDNLWGEKIISSFKIKAYNSWNIKLVICYTTSTYSENNKKILMHKSSYITCYNI